MVYGTTNDLGHSPDRSNTSVTEQAFKAGPLIPRSKNTKFKTTPIQRFQLKNTYAPCYYNMTIGTESLRSETQSTQIAVQFLRIPFPDMNSP